MVLWATVKMNNDVIGVVSCTRQRGDTNGKDPDGVNTYTVEARIDGQSGTSRGEVQHRYGDSALVLLRKALEELTS